MKTFFIGRKRLINLGATLQPKFSKAIEDIFFAELFSGIGFECAEKKMCGSDQNFCEELARASIAHGFLNSYPIE